MTLKLAQALNYLCFLHSEHGAAACGETPAAIAREARKALADLSGAKATDIDEIMTLVATETKPKRPATVQELTDPSFHR